MSKFDEVRVSKAILNAYHKKLSDHLVSDAVIVGAGPSGLLAAGMLARRGWKVVVLEKRLATGGGVWGGAMTMNEVAIQDEVLPILKDLNVRYQAVGEGLNTADSLELASGLCMYALQGGAAVLNMTYAEDVCVSDGAVNGVVINKTGVADSLPIDPLMIMGKAIVDATGHEAALVNLLRKRGLLGDTEAGKGVEGPMNIIEGEKFVEERVDEVYPGLWICGMALCATYGGPRMGPIFGGMLLSGKRLAEMLTKKFG